MEKQTVEAAEPEAEPAARQGPAFSHKGLQYLAFLKRLAERSQPRSYLEIGTRDGSSLAAFDCDAICVDPRMRPKPGALDRTRTFCFQMTSDRFFHEIDVRSLLPNGVDVAFLDGMHRYEFLLRDFINAERCCHSNSMILVHDCFPAKPNLTGRVATGAAWAGDVWKLVPILRELRDDLVLYRLDCPPTGLLVIQNLDPQSEALQRGYHAAVKRYAPVSLREYGVGALWSSVEMLDSRKLADDEEDWSLTLPSY